MNRNGAIDISGNVEFSTKNFETAKLLRDYLQDVGILDPNAEELLDDGEYYFELPLWEEDVEVNYESPSFDYPGSLEILGTTEGELCEIFADFLARVPEENITIHRLRWGMNESVIDFSYSEKHTKNSDYRTFQDTLQKAKEYAKNGDFLYQCYHKDSKITIGEAFFRELKEQDEVLDR